MKKKNKKYSKYCLGNMWLMLIAAVNILALFLPYVTGVIPIEFLNGSAAKITSIFGIMFTVLKALPALAIFVVQLFPADAIKKYVVTCFCSIWLLGGEVLSSLILLQRYDADLGFGFYGGILSALMVLVLCFVFTKINKAPAKHKDMVWYRGFNKIALLVGMPICVAFTVGIVMFAGLVFRFPFITVLGIMCLWGCLVICSIVAVLTLFEKYKVGMLYYLVAFLSAVSIVALCWSDNIFLMLFGIILASVSGVFCLMLGGVVKKYF